MAQIWDKGVELELHGLGKYRTVTSTEEAARHLTGHEWPDKQSPAFRAAVKAIIAALEKTDDELQAAKARKAFIKAADKAAIYVRSQ